MQLSQAASGSSRMSNGGHHGTLDLQHQRHSGCAHIADDLRTCVQQLKDATPDDVLRGRGKLATARLLLVSAKPLRNGVVVMHYQRAR